MVLTGSRALGYAGGAGVQRRYLSTESHRRTHVHPATYRLFEQLRELLRQVPEAARAYKPQFSFNVKGGRARTARAMA